MKRLEIRQFLCGLCVTIGLGVVFVTATATADNPAAAIAPQDERARTSFKKFTRDWMKKVQRLADEQKPTARSAASNALVTYRGYTDDFTFELRPTGHASAPFVGILRYSEQIFSCRDIAANDCTISSEIPVTEIFRYQDGRWVY